MRNRCALNACVVLVCLARAESPANPEPGARKARVAIHLAQGEAVFTGHDADRVRHQLRRLVTSCSVDSIRCPSIFPETSFAAWSRVLSMARLLVADSGPERLRPDHDRADLPSGDRASLASDLRSSLSSCTRALIACPPAERSAAGRFAEVDPGARK